MIGHLEIKPAQIRTSYWQHRPFKNVRWTLKLHLVQHLPFKNVRWTLKLHLVQHLPVKSVRWTLKLHLVKHRPFKKVRWTLRLHLVLTSYASKEIEEKRESKRVNFKQTLISVPFFVNSLT